MIESVDMVESIPGVPSSSDGYGSASNNDAEANDAYVGSSRHLTGKSKPETLENDLIGLRERLASLEGQITNIMNDDLENDEGKNKLWGNFQKLNCNRAKQNVRLRSEN